MNVHFCDLCNESIPQADLDLGRAVRRNGRLICGACEAAMSGKAANAAPRAAPAAPRPAGVAAGGSSILAVALAFAAVAVVVSAGSAAWLLVRFDGRMADLQARLSSGQREGFERERRVVAAMDASAGESAAALRGAQESLRRTESRLADLELSSERVRGLADRLDAIEGRLSELARLGGVHDRLSAQVAEVELGLAELREALRSAPAPDQASVVPRTSAPGAVQSAPAAPPAEPSWMGLVGDLTSLNSGTRWQAVQALAKTGDPGVVPHLLPRLEDADIFVRMAAARTLGDLGAVDAIPALIDALEDDEASVREAALVSLRTLSKQDLPFDPLAREGERAKRVKAWRDWWEKR